VYLNQSVLDQLDVRDQQVKCGLETSYFEIVVQRILVNQMSVIKIVQGEALDDCKAAVVLVHIEHLLNPLLPIFRIHTA
jgi:hypothetical protein